MLRFSQVLYWFLALGVCLAACCSGAMGQTPGSLTKQQAIEQLRDLVLTITGDVELRDEQFEIVSQDAGEMRLAGSGSLFGVDGVELSVGITDRLIDVQAEFTKGVSKQIDMLGFSLSSWIPDFLSGRVDLTAVDISFSPQDNDSLELGLTLSPPASSSSWSFAGAKVQDPALKITLERPGGDNATATGKAAVTGGLALGALRFELAAAAGSDQNWNIAATLDRLGVGQLLDEAVRLTGLDLPPLQDALAGFEVDNATLSWDSDGTLRLQGNSDIGALEAVMSASDGGRGGTDFMLILAPKNFRLGQLSSALGPLEGLKLENMAFIYAATAQKLEQSFDLLGDLDLQGLRIKKGLTLLGGYDIPGNLPGLKGLDSVVMRAHLPPQMAGTPTLRASVQFDGLDFGSDFSILDTFVQLDLDDQALGAGISVEGQFGKDRLAFTGIGEISADSTLSWVVFMEDGSVWREPFGLKGIAISELGLDVGAAVVSPIPRPALGLRGSLAIGSLSGAAAGMISTADPTDSMISVQFDELDMERIVESFLDPAVRRAIGPLPSDFGLRDAELTLVPKPMTMAGRDYQPGIRIAGEGHIAGLSGMLDISASFDRGLKGDGELTPIVLKAGGVTLFELRGNRAGDPLRMSFDLTQKNMKRADNPFLLVDGMIDMLGVQGRTKTEINRSGFYFFNEGKLLGVAQAKFDVRGGSLNDDARGFHVRAAMKQDLLNQLTRALNAAVKEATKEAVALYATAKNAVEAAEREVTQKAKEAANAYELLKENEELRTAAWKEVPTKVCKKINLGITKEKVCIPVPKTEIKQAVKTYGKVPSKVCEKVAVIGKVCIPLPNYANLASLVNTAEDAYRDAEKGLEIAEDAADKAANTLGLRKGDLDDIERQLRSGIRDADKLVKLFGENLAEVKSVEFEASLDTVRGGRIETVFNLKYVGQKYHVKFEFDLNDPMMVINPICANLLDPTRTVGRGFRNMDIGKGYANNLRIADSAQKIVTTLDHDSWSDGKLLATSSAALRSGPTVGRRTEQTARNRPMTDESPHLQVTKPTPGGSPHYPREPEGPALGDDSTAVSTGEWPTHFLPWGGGSGGYVSMSQATPGKRKLRIPCRVFGETSYPAQTIVLEYGQSLAINVCADDAKGVRWNENARIENPDLLRQESHNVLRRSRLKMRPNALAHWTFRPSGSGQSYVAMTGVLPGSTGKEWVLFLNVEVKSRDEY